ncbi:MAG TPA: transposase [Gallionellaceae bacterium]
MQYRRAFVPGASYFFTVVTEQRRPILVSPATIATLRAAFRNVQEARPFQINAIVILPDHLHCIWTLPPDDADFSTRWRLLKTHFTKHCDPTLRTAASPARIEKSEQAVWQHRYWEHMLRDEMDYSRHVEYIHYNPVKHGHVASAIEWPYSSFQRYVEAGIYPADWALAESNLGDVGHE